MSDKEMRDQINRAMLERQYNDVILSQQNVSRGKERVDRILETSAAVLGVTSSALAIALAIRDLKSQKAGYYFSKGENYEKGVFIQYSDDEGQTI